MSIFAAPSFYNQADQNIFTGGDRFITQERYRLGDPIQKNMSFDSGITNTTAANMLPLPLFVPRQGGEGGGGITTTAPDISGFDYETDAYGVKDFTASQKGITEEEDDAISSFNNPSLNAFDIGTIGGMLAGFTNPITGILGLVFNKQRKQKQAAERIARERTMQEARELQGRIDAGKFGKMTAQDKARGDRSGRGAHGMAGRAAESHDDL